MWDGCGRSVFPDAPVGPSAAGPLRGKGAGSVDIAAVIAILGALAVWLADTGVAGPALRALGARSAALLLPGIVTVAVIATPAQTSHHIPPPSLPPPAVEGPPDRPVPVPLAAPAPAPRHLGWTTAADA